MTATPARPAPRMFQVYAQVDSVSPSTGSLVGGNVVTIKGKGFPSSAAAGNNAITALKVGGMACPVIFSNFSTITCMTQVEDRPSAAPMNTTWCRWNNASGNSSAVNGTSTNSSAPADPVCWDGSIKGLYPGMRGITYEFFNRWATQLLTSSSTCMHPSTPMPVTESTCPPIGNHASSCTQCLPRIYVVHGGPQKCCVTDASMGF